MESLRVRLATGAARCSARYVTRGLPSSEFGARGLAAEIVSSPRLAEVEGRASTARMLKGRKRTEAESWLLRNPLAALRKQRACRLEFSLSRVPPYRPFSARPSASRTVTKARSVLPRYPQLAVARNPA